MKQKAILISIIIFSMIKFTLANDNKFRTRPDYIPSTPLAAKPITAYTAEDVFGAVVTGDELPAGHPYRENDYEEGLKAKWPGAKDSKQIDVMIQIVLDAPPAERKDILAFSNIRNAVNDIYYIMWEVMDISDAERVEALVRVVDAQTDPEKKYQAKKFAASLFRQLLDPRLLAYGKEDLDNTRVVFNGYITDETRATITARKVAKDSILAIIEELGIPKEDLARFRGADEAGSCAELKAWLTENWNLVVTKCLEAQAKPDRDKPNFIIRCWAARW